MANNDANMDLEQLSPAQQEALQQYTAVTDQDVAAAIPVLQRSEWNVQIAVTRFFDGDTAVPTPAPAPAQTRPSGGVEALLNQQRRQNGQSPLRAPGPRPDNAPRIVPQPDSQVIRRPPLLISLILAPFSIIYKIFTSGIGLLGYFFPSISRYFQIQPSSSAIATGRRTLSPQDTAARFKREFEEEFGENNLPFFGNGYAQALDLAKKELKLLLVVLLSPEHDETNLFARETLLSPDFRTFVNDPSHNIILWAGNVKDSEAYQVSTALRCTKFPFTAMISHTAESGPQSMSVVGRIPGPESASSYVAKLQRLVNTYLTKLNEFRDARSAQVVERTIRQEQDSAYERSLALDRQRAKEKREREAAEAAARKAAEEQAAEAERLARKIDQWRRWRAQKLQQEPEAEVTNVVTVAVRMPTSAERVTRRFAQDTDIEELYAWVECYDIVSGEEESSEVTEKPADYSHDYKFRLVSPMPRTVYGIEEGGTLLERLGRRCNLIVEPMSEDSEDGTEA